MSDQNKDDQQSATAVSKLSGLVGLYAVFVYISGWTFLDHFYRYFGLNTLWLDVSITETLTKGFTILFYPGGGYLWLIYLFVIVVPVLFEVFPKLRVHTVAQVVVACLMLSGLPLTYFISANVALRAAQNMQGAETGLREVSFGLKCDKSFPTYSGKLLYIKDGSYYLHNVHLSKGDKETEGCTIPESEVNQLTILRSEVVQHLQIVELPKR